MSGNVKAGGIFKEATDGSTMIAFDVENKEIELNADIRNVRNAGTPGTSVTALEYSDGIRHYTKLSFIDLAVGSATGAAALGFGKLIYTLPAGVQKYNSVYQEIALTAADGNTADTPEIGLGTVVATGAVSVLGGTATFEDILEGTAVGDCNGTVVIDNDLAINQLVATGGAKSIYLNLADTWAAADAITATGFVVIEWTKLV